VQYPQNSQSANYTLVIGDAGKQIFHPASDALSRIYTIPSNASVAFPIGTVVLFTVENGGVSVSVAINSDTLVLGSGVTGTAPVSPNNTLMAIKVTATKWMANYLTQDVPIAPYVFAVANNDAGIYQAAYPFTSGVGFGTRYANPATAISGAASSVDFSPSGNAVAFSTNVTPFLDVYRWSGNGYGARYADAATIAAGSTACVTFSSQGNAIASVNGTFTPNLEAWPWNAQTGFGTKYSNPGTGTLSATRAVVFHPLDTAIAVSSSSSPYINAYTWTSASGFGTKFANPATLPTGAVGAANPRSVAFSAAGDAVAIAHSITPFVTVYPWSGSGFGTKFANPATLPVSTGFGVVFSPAGDAIAVLNGGSPAITVYAWSGAGFGSKYTNPGTLPTGSYAATFTPNGDTIAVADVGSPFIRAYPWSSATGFGTVYADPSTLPTAAANDIASTYNF
jgi:WD40 repeat protein